MIDTTAAENTTVSDPSNFKVEHGGEKQAPAYLEEYYEMQRDKLELI